MPADMLNSALETLHDQSLPAIGLLQQSFPSSYAFMINISIFFDPRYVFLLYAPILFALNKRVGHRMIIALTCCEWSNQVLKWLLAGERPYWYVHERASIVGDLKLKQFPVTCELGAGSPSGHAMVTATVWYVLVDAYLKGELKLFDKNERVEWKNQKRELTGANSFKLSQLLGQIAWSAYWVALVLVSVSRVYLACHFPHQCLCGGALGFLLAKLIVDKLPMDLLKPWHFCLATGLMFASAMATYFFLRARGFNPLWSVDKAQRWCEKPENIHLDTTPFYSMMRYLGFCLGAGLAYDSSAATATTTTTTTTTTMGNINSIKAPISQLGRRLLLLVRRTLVITISIGFGQLLLSIPLSRTNMNLYYAISFLIYTVFAYSFAQLVPDLIKSILPTSVNFYVAKNSSGPNDTIVRKKKISIKKLM